MVGVPFRFSCHRPLILSSWFNQNYRLLSLNGLVIVPLDEDLRACHLMELNRAIKHLLFEIVNDSVLEQ